MSQRIIRPDVGAVLAQLKDFQRDTVDYVFRRLYTDTDAVDRFLVADEVGLGKTLVARGVIARVVDHLWDEVDRIDIIYICSNTDIARQNISRLNVGLPEIALASRITLLPITVHDLRAHKVNLISFTPGTSFDLRSNFGIMEERALLYWLLDRAWNIRGRVGPLKVLRGDAGFDRFAQSVETFPRYYTIDPTLADSFLEHLEESERESRERGEPTLHERFEALARSAAHRPGGLPRSARADHSHVIGTLRTILARTCLDALEPDLIILDEFQRFKHLLDGQDAASQLARDLFTYRAGVARARVLLLSATPYKMYTLDEEAESDDHYRDFIDTIRFLLQSEAETQEIGHLLREYRRALYQLGVDRDGTLARLRLLSADLEARLRRVMVRTERLAASSDRNGMLTEMPPPELPVAPSDIHAYLETQQLADLLDQGDMVEYWKSAPFLVNFMEGYKLKEAIEAASAVPAQAQQLASLLANSRYLLFPLEEWRRYAEIDPGNARLRHLVRDTLDRGMWRWLWLPGALQYYELSGVYADVRPEDVTKRLVFSAWRVAPKVIAALMSYEAERRMVRTFDEAVENSPEARRRFRPLLRFTRHDGRLTGMPVFGMLYPSVVLAAVTDPLAIARDLGAADRGMIRLPRAAAVLAEAERRIEAMLAELPSGAASGPEDESWYWAAPILLDQHYDPAGTTAWFNRPGLATRWTRSEEFASEGDEDSLWAEHVEHARQVLDGSVRLGRRPADLAQVLALLGVGGPAIAAFRALSRVAGSTDPSHVEAVRDSAAHIAWGFRTLFNVPDVSFLLRGLDRREPYWRRVLEYGVAGGIQAVLDEYVHVLQESLGLLGHDPVTVAHELASGIFDALTLRTASLRLDHLMADGAEQPIGIERYGVRARFAVRFGDQHAEDDRVLARASQVRTAFNSPFWPFVLATTSIGQEGLDFHPYCHAVVHWNLPSNPVDLEQREGRVHRYKGHAVRKNVARQYGHLVLGRRSEDGGRDDLRIAQDPWAVMFAAAAAERSPTASDIVPYWVFPVEGGATIERHVPALPLSRDRDRLERLRRALTVYRMAFGQPRQEDLVAYLMAHIPADETLEALRELQINLAPPGNGRLLSG